MLARGEGGSQGRLKIEEPGRLAGYGGGGAGRDVAERGGARVGTAPGDAKSLPRPLPLSEYSGQWARWRVLPFHQFTAVSYACDTKITFGAGANKRNFLVFFQIDKLMVIILKWPN